MNSIVHRHIEALKKRLAVLLEDSYEAIEHNEEVDSIFVRYNSLRDELVAQSDIFKHLLKRQVKLHEGSSTVDRKSLLILQQDIAEAEEGLELLSYSDVSQTREREAKYWSQRTKPASSADWLKNSVHATLSLINRLKRSYYFAEFFGNHCSYCEGGYGLNCDRVNERLGEHIPGLTYPPQKVSADDLFDLIEFFYDHASLPTSWAACGGDDNRCPQSYSGMRGKARFANEVNIVFTRFGAPYRLAHGRIIRASSPVIEQLLEHPILTDDQKLNELITRAVQAFKDKSDRRVEAAEICCKAFEHFKKQYGDSKTGAETLIRKVVPHQNLFDNLNMYWKALTTLGHEAVRHSKPEAPSISDPIFAEYLFLQYYSAIYFATRKTASTEDDVFSFNLDETIPF